MAGVEGWENITEELTKELDPSSLTLSEVDTCFVSFVSTEYIYYDICPWLLCDKAKRASSGGNVKSPTDRDFGLWTQNKTFTVSVMAGYQIRRLNTMVSYQNESCTKQTLMIDDVIYNIQFNPHDLCRH